jgi:hypothetical protein
MDKLSDADVDRLINASADNASSEQKAADDWLAAFAKKSQEALARRDAEQKAAPRPDDKVLIERLARKDHTEYDRMRADLAETLGIRVGTLDDKVEAIRKKLAVEDDEEACRIGKSSRGLKRSTATRCSNRYGEYSAVISFCPLAPTSPSRFGYFTLGRTMRATSHRS